VKGSIGKEKGSFYISNFFRCIKSSSYDNHLQLNSHVCWSLYLAFFKVFENFTGLLQPTKQIRRTDWPRTDG